ncbi:MAG TPA: hypothetical protein VFM18_09165 [Methanosarcina sp.]|nr:hypothetical protein [Methanosarcina sp.]
MSSPKRKRKIQRHTIPHRELSSWKKFLNDFQINHKLTTFEERILSSKNVLDTSHGGSCDKCGAFHSYEKFGFYKCQHSFCKGMVMADIETKDGLRLDKGVKGKACNVTACQRDGAWYHNIGNNKYYCAACAKEINWPGGRADAQRIYGRPLLCEYDGPNGNVFEEEIQAKKTERAREMLNEQAQSR